MKLPRREFLYLAAGAATLSAVSRITWAQAYPSRPVSLVAGFAPGGGVDITARLIGQWLSERLGQQFVIENRPGASSNIATEAVVRASADGYTLLLIGSFNSINATLYDTLNYNFTRDIAPVASVMRYPYVMVVNPSFPAKSVLEFIAYAKANPGKLNMASPGTGTGDHIAGELFKMMTGVDMVDVTYRGIALALSDLLGGQVQVSFPSILSSIQYIRAGQLRALAVVTATRSDARCRIPRPWLSSCRVTRRAAGTASVHRRPHRPRSSTSSTRRSTLPSPIQRTRRGLPAPSARRGEIEGAAGQVLHRFAGTDDLHRGPL